MATLQLFFQSGRAKDLSAPLYMAYADKQNAMNEQLQKKMYWKCLPAMRWRRSTPTLACKNSEIDWM